MTINKNDLNYILLGLTFSIIGAVVIASQNTLIGLYGVAAILAVGLVIAIYIKPDLGAIILVVVVFTNISSIFTENGLPSINKPLVAVVAAAILVRYNNSTSSPNGRGKTGAIETFLFLFFMMTALSYLAADNKDRAIEAILDLGKDIVIIYCFLFVLRHPDTWRRSAWLVILVTAFLCLLGGYQVLTGNYSQVFYGLAGVFVDVSENFTTYRIAGPITEPNIWGQIVVAVVPLVVYRIIYERRLRMKLFSVGILVVLLYEILNTYSRGAYIALGVLFILVLLMQRVRPLTWFALIASVVLIFPLLPASYTSRFQTLILLSPATKNGVYQESSFRGRTSKVLTGLIMFANNPILGVGAGNYPNNYQKYTVEVGLELDTAEQEAHSLYVQILAETGILGAISFIGFSVLLLVNLSRARRSIEHLVKYQNWVPWISAIQLSIIGYLITSAFLHGAYIRYFWIFVAFALSAIQLTEELLVDPNNNHSLESSV